MAFIIRDFDWEDGEQAAKAATMFNDWDSVWPGGFTRGVPNTAAQVQEEHRRDSNLAVLVVEHEGEFVGYCNLEAAPGQKDVSYIGLLGANEKVHGKGVGKMLLREMIRRVTEYGYKQVTLGTWAGNTKAVPLYKKTGFHWIPETDVFMRNFIPGLLAMPLVQSFLDGRDWYDCLERDLTVAPDDVTWNGMKVYPYQFRNGERTLELWFDRTGEGLTALETPDVALSCLFPFEDAPGGQAYPVVWEARAKNGASLDAVLLAEGETGLALSVQERLSGLDTARIERELKLDSSLAPKKGDVSTYAIKTTFLLHGQPLVFATGVHVTRPVEIHFTEQRLLPGREEQIRVKMRNRLDRDLEGTLTLAAHPDLICATPMQPLLLPAKSWTECTFAVTATSAGVKLTRLICEAASLRVEHPVTFRGLTPGGVVGSVDVEREEAILESLELRVSASLRGGGANIFYAPTMQGLLRLPMLEVGPPFTHGWMREPLVAGWLETGSQGETLVLTGASPMMPHLIVERRITLMGSVARLDCRVTNTGNVSTPAKIRLRSWPTPKDYVVAPLTTGLIREPLQTLEDYPRHEYDVLPQGATLAENWFACEGDNTVCGLVVEGSPELSAQWTRLLHLTYDLGEMPPYGVKTLPPVYAVGGAGTWKTVRDTWKMLAQPSGVIETEAPQPQRVLQVNIAPNLLTEIEQTVNVTVTNNREAVLSGTLRLTGTAQCEPEEFALDAVNRDNPFSSAVKVGLPNIPGARLITAQIDAVPVPQTRVIGVANLGRGSLVRVSQPDDAHIDVHNGHLSFRVAPAYVGAMVSLERLGVNHLRSCYPTPQPLMWVNPWYGGLHPYLGWMGDPRLPRETFMGEAAARTGETGLAWQGVRVVCEPKHKDLTWLKLEVEYLTCGGSNVVALVTRWTNKTSATMQVPGDGGIGAWLQVGGTHENAIVHADISGERQIRRRGGFGMDTYAGTWKAVENGESGQTLLMVATGTGKAVVQDFAKEGAHLSAEFGGTLQPNETREHLAWLVLMQNTYELDAYVAALSLHKRLP